MGVRWLAEHQWASVLGRRRTRFDVTAVLWSIAAGSTTAVLPPSCRLYCYLLWYTTTIVPCTCGTAFSHLSVGLFSAALLAGSITIFWLYK